MTATLQRLLKTPKLKPDESFTGYILRLTEENGYSSPSWIINLANFENNLTLPNYSFRSISAESFELLASLSNSTGLELAQITYQRVDTRSRLFHAFFGAPIHRSFIQAKRPKICSECLREAAYCRRIWEFILITVCPIHRCMLIDQCPNCNRPIKWVRTSVCICPCKFDWRESTVLPVGDLEVNLARVIHHLCGLPCGEDSHDFSRHNPVLKLSLQDLTQVVIFTAGQLQGSSLTLGWHLLSIKKVKSFHHLFAAAYYIFDDWPTHFYKFLNWWRTNERAAHPGYRPLNSVLYKDFGKLYMGLYEKLSASQFNFIRKAFIDYLVKEWDGCDLSFFARNRNIEHSDKVKYISKSDAKLLLDTDDAWINRLIWTGRLKTKVRSKGMKRLIFVDVLDVANLAHRKGQGGKQFIDK
jgi:hypothetical protein